MSHTIIDVKLICAAFSLSQCFRQNEMILRKWPHKALPNHICQNFKKFGTVPIFFREKHGSIFEIFKVGSVSAFYLLNPVLHMSKLSQNLQICVLAWLIWCEI